MVEKHSIINTILMRRSVAPRRLTSPGPNHDEIQLLVQAALAAADHGLLRPTRFVHVQDSARKALATVFANSARESNANINVEAELRESEKAHHAPCLIAIIARLNDNHAVVPVSEQWISVGASIQNMLLASEALGFRAMIVSGNKVRSNAIRQAFVLGDNEFLVGFLAIGTTDSAPLPKERPQIDDHLSNWSGPIKV